RGYISTAPDAASVFPAFITVPPLPVVPAALHGTAAIALVACYAGDASQAEDIMHPLRTFGPPAADLLGPMPYSALQSLFDDGVPYGAFNYWKSDYLSELSDDCIEVLVQHTAELPVLSPLTTVHIYPLGGAIGRVGTRDTAYAHRDARFTFVAIG